MKLLAADQIQVVANVQAAAANAEEVLEYRDESFHLDPSA